MRVATFSFPAQATAFPNDMTFDGSHRLLVTDSFGGKVWVATNLTADGPLTPWATDASLAPVHASAFGADGITWDGASNLYVNNNDTGAIVRIAVAGDGSAGAITRS
jgi:sugar lactone lactonase YvrE